MKKKYIKPFVLAVNLDNSETILAGSGTPSLQNIEYSNDTADTEHEIL